MDELKEHVPKGLKEAFTKIVALTDTFCDAHLNEEYKQLCQEMAVAVGQEGLPITRGKPRSWAAGIVYSVGWVNFLNDPSQDPHMKTADLAEATGVSEATIMAKAKVIRKGLSLMRLDPNWWRPSRVEDNPLVWMLEVNGFLMDIRSAPREAQVVAYEKGLIPFIPADRENEE